jgi:NodT family efflux transporter outer membrane factor (OMF) lipoprotein
VTRTAAPEKRAVRNPTTRSALLFAAPLLAAACKVGPDFEPPKSELPDAFGPSQAAPAAPISRVTTDPVTTVRWWSLLGEPALDALIERAFEANPDVHLAQARLREARAARGEAEAALLPEVDVSAAYRRSSATVVAPSRKGELSATHDLYQAGFDAAWEVDVFGGARRGVEAADADLQAVVEDERDLLVTLAAEVTVDYCEVVGARRQAAIARDNLEAQTRTADLVRRRQLGGFVSSLDVANAEAQMAITRSTLPGFEIAARQSLVALTVLLDRSPAELEQQLAAAAAIPGVPPVVPMGLPSDLVRRRPDVRRAEAELHAATARIGVATSDLYPKLSITGDLGVSADRVTGLDRWSNRSWSIGPTISWPVLDFGRVRNAVHVEEARAEQSQILFRQTVLVALQEVESALVAYVQEQERHSALSEAVAANRRAVSLATTLYTQGQSGFLPVLDAQRSLFLAEDALVQSDRNQATGLAALCKALGGGWEEALPEPPPEPAASPTPPTASAP